MRCEYCGGSLVPDDDRRTGEFDGTRCLMCGRRPGEGRRMVETIETSLRKCQGCGIEFRPRRKDQVFHDTECGRLHRAPRSRKKREPKPQAQTLPAVAGASTQTPSLPSVDEAYKTLRQSIRKEMLQEIAEAILIVEV